MQELNCFEMIKLNATDLKKLLVQENIFRLPVLFISAINKHHNSFEMIKQLYEENLTTKEIKEMLTSLNKAP